MKEDITLKKVQLGEFEVRVSSKKVVIQTKNKDWSVVYGESTKPYADISSLVLLDEADMKMTKAEASELHSINMSALQTLILALYNQVLFFSNVELVKGWYDMVSDYLRSVGVSKATDEEHDEAIEDVKNIEKIREEVKSEDVDTSC